MYEVKVQCLGVPEVASRSAGDDIVEEFEQRPWHTNVRCFVDGTALVVVAVNDYDVDGLALLDEFSDAVIACLDLGDATVSFEVISVASVPSPP
jgi:hypothetical protein